MSTQPPLLPAARRLRGLLGGGIFALLLALAILPAVSLTPPGMAPCVFHGLTGLPCPLCGGTRAAVALLHGDPGRAWHLNGLAFPALGLLLALAVLSLVEAIRGRPLLQWRVRGRQIRIALGVSVILLFLWWIPQMWRALEDPKAELLDLRNPVARQLHEAMQR